MTLPVPSQAQAQASFEALYRSCAADLYAYVASLLRDRAAAEDVTAQAFERALRKRRSFDARRGSERAWLFGIARNAALDELRGRRRRSALHAEPVDGGPPVEDHVESSTRRETVRAALSLLEPADRELVALKFFAGLTNPEIAKVIGTSESNAGTRLHRAVTKLREACNDT